MSIALAFASAHLDGRHVVHIAECPLCALEQRLAEAKAETASYVAAWALLREPDESLRYAYTPEEAATQFRAKLDAAKRGDATYAAAVSNDTRLEEAQQAAGEAIYDVCANEERAISKGSAPYTATFRRVVLVNEVNAALERVLGPQPQTGVMPAPLPEFEP